MPKGSFLSLWNDEAASSMQLVSRCRGVPRQNLAQNFDTLFCSGYKMHIR